MTYRKLRQGEIVPWNAEFRLDAEWIKTGSAGRLPTAGIEYRVPLDEPEPTTTMSNQINDGGAAFPRTLPDVKVNPDEALRLIQKYAGMSLRQYASIKLRVPDSGTDWLDAMILQSKRDEFAGQALTGALANPILLEMHGSYAMTAEACMNFADAMIEARNQQQPQ